MYPWYNSVPLRGPQEKDFRSGRAYALEAEREPLKIPYSL